MILKYSQYILKWKEFIVLFAVNIESLKILKYHIFFQKKLAVSIICYKCGNEDKKISKEEESVDILKILDLIGNMEEYQKNTWLFQKYIWQWKT